MQPKGNAVESGLVRLKNWFGHPRWKRRATVKNGGSLQHLFILALIAYAGYKISVLEGKKSIDIIQAIQENYFDDSYVFSNKQGMNIAAAVFSPFLSDYQKPIDPSYGKIIFQKVDWGRNEKGQFYRREDEIASHTCTSEELGFSGSNHRFWPIKEN